MSASVKTIRTKCQITGISFSVPFSPLPISSTLSRSYGAEDIGLRHPVFYLPWEQVKAIAVAVAQSLISEETEEEKEITGAGHYYRILQKEDLSLVLPALWNSTGLITYISRLPLPSEATTFNLIHRTIEICTWINGRGLSTDVPRFCVEQSTKDNLYVGFLKELEGFRDSLAERRKRNDLNAQMQEVTIRAERRELYGKTVLTPTIISRVCSLIDWDLPEMKVVATKFLTLDPIEIINLLAAESLKLKDLSDLLLDVELLDWQSSLRDTVLTHLRTLVNIIHTFRPLNAEEKGLFTDVINPVKSETQRDLIPMAGEKITVSNKAVILVEPRPDLFTVSPALSRPLIAKGAVPPWRKFTSANTALVQDKSAIIAKEHIAEHIPISAVIKEKLVPTVAALPSPKYELMVIEPETTANTDTNTNTEKDSENA